MNKRIKVACLIPEKILWEGITRLLGQHQQLTVLNLDPLTMTLFDLVNSDVDIVITEIKGPLLADFQDMNAVLLCNKLCEINPSIKIIACSDKVRIETVNAFFEAGGSAFVSRRSSYVELIKAIELVRLNERYVCPIIGSGSRNLIRFMNGTDAYLKSAQHVFTPAETNVLIHISEGYSTKQIAAMLNLSEKTIETHRKHLFDKSGVKNVAELMVYAFSHKLLLN